MYIYVRRGTQILLILVGDAQILLAKIEKPPPPTSNTLSVSSNIKSPWETIPYMMLIWDINFDKNPSWLADEFSSSNWNSWYKMATDKFESRSQSSLDWLKICDLNTDEIYDLRWPQVCLKVGHSSILIGWSHQPNSFLVKDNNVGINETKTKDLLISVGQDLDIPLLDMNGIQIESVHHSKLLGMIISEDLKWGAHILDT